LWLSFWSLYDLIIPLLKTEFGILLMDEMGEKGGGDYFFDKNRGWLKKTSGAVSQKQAPNTSEDSSNRERIN